MPKMVALAGVLGAAFLLWGCMGGERVIATLQQEGCKVRAVTGDPCPPAPRAPEAARYCYRTLAGVDCYADEIRYNPDPGWLRSPPPDLTR